MRKRALLSLSLIRWSVGPTNHRQPNAPVPSTLPTIHTPHHTSQSTSSQLSPLFSVILQRLAPLTNTLAAVFLLKFSSALCSGSLSWSVSQTSHLHRLLVLCFSFWFFFSICTTPASDYRFDIARGDHRPSTSAAQPIELSLAPLLYLTSSFTVYLEPADCDCCL